MDIENEAGVDQISVNFVHMKALGILLKWGYGITCQSRDLCPVYVMSSGTPA